jgi:hypothetical protein
MGLQHVQWVFIGEGVPSVLLGVCLPWLLPDGPHASDGSVTRWLAPHEVQLLQADVSANSSVAGVTKPEFIMDACRASQSYMVLITPQHDSGCITACKSIYVLSSVQL